MQKEKKTDKFYPVNINWPVIEQSLCGRKIFPSDRSADLELTACIDKTLRCFIEKSNLPFVQKIQKL